MRRWRSWFRFSLRSHESPEVAAAACSFNRFEPTAAVDEYLGVVSAGTVGFGEISPSTGIGRMVAIVVIVTIVILVPLATNELLQVLASTTQWRGCRALIGGAVSGGTAVSQHMTINIPLLKQYQERLNWDLISSERILNEEIILEFEDFLNFELLLKNEKQQQTH
jgi:hypothetical protein